VALLATVGLGAVTALLVIRVPENRISWLALTVVLTLVLLLDVQQVSTSNAFVEGVYAIGLFSVIIPGLAILMPLWFPTGRPPTPKWQWVAWLAYAGSAAAVVGWGIEALFGAGSSSDIACTSPGSCIEAGAVAVVLIGSVAAVASFVVRWRRAEGVERLQLQWLVPSFTVFGGGVVAEFGGFEGSAAANFMLPAGLALMFISIAVAILRYRLYEIRRIISRTVTYAVVIGTLGVGYAVAVLLFSPLGPESMPWLTAPSTLAVAALFNPLRRRVQRWAERRFDRARYDAQVVAELLTRSLRASTDGSTAMTDLAGVTDRIFRPRSVHVWIREVGT
jgi:hypothetical protein